MTDNEIKKALECCTTRDGCKSCPRSYNGEMCRGDTPTEMIRDALDLINRLEAETDQWKEEANRYQKLWCEAEEDIQTAKAEAVKEFAEMVDKEITDAIFANDKVIQARVTRYRLNRYEDDLCITCDGKIRALDGIKCFIDNLAKEMVGEA